MEATQPGVVQGWACGAESGTGTSGSGDEAGDAEVVSPRRDGRAAVARPRAADSGGGWLTGGACSFTQQILITKLN